MKGNSKKIISLFLVLVLLFSMSYSAFAAAAETVSNVSVTLLSNKKQYKNGEEIKIKTKVKNETEDKQYVSIVYSATPLIKSSSMGKYSVKQAEVAAGESSEYEASATAKRAVFSVEWIQSLYDAVFGSLWSAFYMIRAMFSDRYEAISVKVDGVSAVIAAEVTSSATLPGEEDPTKPDEPTNPTEPTQPTEPTDPTEPTQPTEPVVPMEIKIDQSSCETKENKIVLTGTYSCNNLKTISYMVDPFFYETGSSETGEVIIDGNKWTTTITLKPGDNGINVTVSDQAGEHKSAKINVKYNIGESYTYTDEDVSYDENEGVNYINNIIVIFFKRGTASEKIDEVVNSINGEYAGVNYSLNSYQIRVAASNLDDLYAIVDKLCEKYDCIAFADIDTLSSSNVAVNDPWKGDVDEADWLDSDVDGSNWGLEAVEAQFAWDYANRFSRIKIGVVDNGFSRNHPDFAGSSIHLLSTEDSIEKDSDHGTHVAGIIGATANNEIGMTGVMFNKANLLCYDAMPYYPDSTPIEEHKFSGTEIYNGFTTLVESGAKVINFSLGSSRGLKDNASRVSSRKINDAGKRASLAMAALLNQGYDFVVVQSAGNGAKDHIGVDAINNGTFCTVTRANCYTEGDVSVDDVLNRIIIVSAAEQFGSGYRLTKFSNAGAQATIAAPGKSIYSTVNNTYASWGGTSMAAPIVTGIAGLVWSVNSDFTGADVKDIVVSTARDSVSDNLESPNTTGDMRLVNAKLAVEEAIRRTDGDGRLKFKVLDAADGYPVVNNAKLVCKAYEGHSTIPMIGKEYSPDGNRFDFALPAGKYKFEISAPSYITLNFEAEVFSNQTTDLGVIVLSKSVNENEVRVVLTWRNEPSDLDSHFNGITTSASDYHVYYSDRGESDMAWLDVDDTEYEGPETITIDMTKFKSFTYSVHNYSHHGYSGDTEYSLELAQSGAMVTVYVKDKIVAFFNVPTNRKGTAWHVFAMNDEMQIMDISTLSSSFEYDTSGGSTVGAKYRLNPNRYYDD